MQGNYKKQEAFMDTWKNEVCATLKIFSISYVVSKIEFRKLS